MRLSEKQIEKILCQNIELSDTVNERINETYKMLLTEQKNQHSPVRRKKHSYIAAAIAVFSCLFIPTVVYAAVNSEFLDGMFGNTTKKSTPAVTKEIDNQKGGTTSVTFPSREYVSVDPKEAEELIGSGVISEPIEIQLGEHTLRIENMIYDKNSAFMYFTLKREGGVTMLIGNEKTNQSKGAYFNEDDLWVFTLETTDGTQYGSNIYIDTEKSTEDMFYCYAYMLSFEELKEGEFPVLKLYKYPCSRIEWTKKHGKEGIPVEEEIVSLTDEPPLPVKKIDAGENGYIEYSPVSIAIDMSKGLGLSEEEASDFVSRSHLEIKYKDGTSYVIYDSGDNVDNTSYELGTEQMMKSAYNRLVNTEEIKEIIVNDTVFPVE